MEKERTSTSAVVVPFASPDACTAFSRELYPFDREAPLACEPVHGVVGEAAVELRHAGVCSSESGSGEGTRSGAEHVALLGVVHDRLGRNLFLILRCVGLAGRRRPRHKTVGERQDLRRARWRRLLQHG